MEPPPRLTTWQSLRAVAGSWRLLSVALLSFSSGLPLGLVWIAIPTWMAKTGVDIRVVGLFSLAQSPWSFKFLWSPLMDRFALPWLSRKRGWVLAAQALLLVLGLALAVVARTPERVLLIGAITLLTGFVAATQDIAYDGWVVEVLRREEYGMAVGARVALYRLAMFVSGGVAITLSGSWSWPRVHLLLALCYVPCMLVTLRAPDAETPPAAPRGLREAVLGPFLGLLGQHRALEILAFVVLYKLCDALSQSLIRPFLVQKGYGDFDVGVATLSIGTAALLLGTFLGGLLTQWRGLGPGLWISGVLQVGANFGYAAVAAVGVNRPLMYAAQALEMGTSGMATGAFGVLLLRLTQKRFSATQYALLSSLFSLPRILGGPVAGVLAASIGWRDFFLLTVVAGIPGLWMLQRFAPWGVREPEFHVAAARRGPPLAPGSVRARGLLGVACGLAIGAAAVVAAASLKATRAGRPFGWAAALEALLAPAGVGDWVALTGIAVLGLAAGLVTVAALLARRGIETGPQA